MKNTGEEIQFGEEVVLDFTKDTEHSIKHHHLEVKFIPELVDLMLEYDIIEEKEINEHSENTMTIEETINALIEDFELLESKMERLEGSFKDLLKSVKAFCEVESPKGEMIDFGEPKE